MGSKQSNPQEDEYESQYNNMFEKIEEIQLNMVRAVEAAETADARMLPVIEGFTSMVQPTKWMLTRLAEKRGAGLPTERKRACEKIWKKFQKVLCDTLEFTPSLNALFKSQMTGAEVLEMVHTRLAGNTSPQDPCLEYLLQEASKLFGEGQAGAQASKDKASTLMTRWTALQEDVQTEISELGKYAEDLDKQKLKMMVLGRIAVVGLVVAGFVCIHLGGVVAGAIVAAKAAAAKAAAAKAAAAAATSHAAAAQNASFFAADWWNAASLLDAAHIATVQSAAASASAAAAGHACTAAAVGAAVSGAAAKGAAAGAIALRVDAASCVGAAHDIHITGQQAETLAAHYKALMDCSTSSEKALTIIMTYLSNVNVDSKDLQRKCDIAVHTQIMDLLTSQHAANQLTKYKSTLSRKMNATDKLEQASMKGLVDWVGSKQPVPSSSFDREVRYPVRERQPENSGGNPQTDDSSSTVESITITATPTLSSMSVSSMLFKVASD